MDARIAEDEKLRFETQIKNAFDFLERKESFLFHGVRTVGGTDPRDCALVASYSRNDMRLKIGWQKYEKSLAILIEFNRDDLSREERYVYFEAFIEFFTEGKTKALVPYVRPGMSIGQIEAVMAARDKLFSNGLDVVLKALGDKLQTFLYALGLVQTQSIQHYHGWMRR